MSELSMYELGDIIWDDFDRGDDHIVPHPTNARTSRNSFEGDIKKPRCETTPVFSNTGNLDVSNTICQVKAEGDSEPLDKNKNRMEKESPFHAPPGAFNSSGDGEIVTDMLNSASDDARMSNSCFKSIHVTSGGDFCADDQVLNGTSAAGDNDSHRYPLTHISQEGDLCFVDNTCEDKESGDLLLYGWPDMGNFEDVDKMLRSCDSSFGLCVTNNDDELGWFTSHQIEGTEETLKMDFKFPCPEPSGLKNILMDHDSPESNNHKSSCNSESKDELNFKDQINLQKKQLKYQNQTEGKKAGQGIGNADGSFYQTSDLTSHGSRISSINNIDQVFTCVGNRQQYRNLEPDYSGHMQRNTPYLPPEYPHPTMARPMVSGIKCEQKGFKSPSPMGSSYASNQGHSMGSSGDPSRLTGMMFQSSESVLVSAVKEGRLSKNELENQSDMKGVRKEADIGSLNAPDSSSVSSKLDEISLEATSFRQLRQIMEQLDFRTKLCIRDSLYRLARSAEQRHNNPGLSSSAIDINDLGGPLMSERTNKCTGFMDVETDTNPIDRSVAHLLFHRPSESPNFPVPLPPKPRMNHRSNTGASMMADKLVYQQEFAGESMTRSLETDITPD